MELNPSQQAAVNYESSHLLLLAGAGSGKTRTIIARAIYLIEKGVPSYRILLLTFTRRAAKEMKERLLAEIGSIANEVVAGTFHFYCLSVLKRMPKAFGITDANIIDRDDQISLMKMARSSFANKDKSFPAAGTLTNYYSYARNSNRPIREHIEKYTDYDAETLGKMLKIFQMYEDRKKKNNYLDFDDILDVYAKRVQDDPRIRDQIKSLFDHILVDEMQDTNPLQWLILESMMNPAKLFCVGDDAQSIYAFRGADFRNVHSFKERVPDSSVMKLEDNYRSTQEILDLSNWLLKKSSLTYDKELRAVRGTGFRPKLLDFSSEFHEARWIADDMLERYESFGKWCSFMILTRTVWNARALEAVLAEKKIPYIFIGGTSLFNAAHVKDIMSLLRVVQNHHDELAWMRYLTLWPGIGDIGAEKAVSCILDVAAFDEAVEIISKHFAKSPQTANVLQSVMTHINEPRNAVAKASELLSNLLKSRYDRWDRRFKDFTLLTKLATNHKTLREFIEAYTLDPISNSYALRLDEDDKVTLITVHSAKGTEAPICYIIQCQTGVFPHARSLGNEDEEEEERRILYVAITRAKDELILTRANYGSSSIQGASFGCASRAENEYFLADIPDGLVEHEVHGFYDGGRPTFSTLQDHTT